MVYSAWFILILISILNCFRIIVNMVFTNVGEFRSYVIFYTKKMKNRLQHHNIIESKI